MTTLPGLGAATLVVALAACHPPPPFERAVQPVAGPVANVCLEENPKVVVGGFFLGMIKALDKNGIAVRTFLPPTPADCPVILRYVAFNNWDQGNFLGRFDVTVFRDETQIGSMRYLARQFAKDDSKFNPPEETLTPMVKQLFPNG